jgi:ABC-type nitrate/sulfonate/bicarbonate transport system substrate-binding protein
MAGVVWAGTGTGLLVGCSDEPTVTGPEDPEPAPPDLGVLSYQLMWVRDSEFSGQYVADSRGYYAGFSSVNLVPGGPTVDVEATVAAGKVLLGVSDPQRVASAVVDGADLVIVGAVYQKNPFAVCSRADAPIATPADLAGRRIGVPPTEQAIWSAFLAVNGVPPASVTVVPAPAEPGPLLAGELDGWFGLAIDEPNRLRLAGVEPVVMLLADHGLPLTGQNHVVTRETLERRRPAVKAALLGDVKGWRAALVDPRAGVDLAVNTYGKDLALDPRLELLLAQQQHVLVLTDETAANGLLTISEQRQDEVVEALGAVGVRVGREQLFDLSVLAEVYDENPALVREPGA